MGIDSGLLEIKRNGDITSGLQPYQAQKEEKEGPQSSLNKSAPLDIKPRLLVCLNYSWEPAKMA